MDETSTTPQPAEGSTGAESGNLDESFSWTGADSVSGESAGGAPAEPGGSASAREALGQLQRMIDTVATHAGPVLREISAKAAELAAVAAENAGPVARRAADVTEHAGARLAERSRALAEELRREATAKPEAGANGHEQAAPAAEPTEAPEHEGM